MNPLFRIACTGLFLISPALAAPVSAPAFNGLPQDARVALMPLNVELFMISAGGLPEPVAEWSAQARENMSMSIRNREAAVGRTLVTDIDADDPQVVGLIRLHGTVASAIALHHYMDRYELPTKGKQLDWRLTGDTARLAERTGADYGLFIFLRDSYATMERKATMVVAALFKVNLGGGAQVGYASLVDLRSGRVVWFNRLSRQWGDLRDRASAEGTMDVLLEDFPQ